MPASERRLTVLGGGGFRVPLVYGALLGGGSPVTEVVLYDVDHGRLAAISRVLEAQAAGVPHAPRVVATTDLSGALTGASFVFSAIRVHGLAGRVIDERVALGEGVLGQETVGAGGVSYGLRTVPVADAIARRIALVAPDAWVINFTNPAGLVTEAMAVHLGDRVIGICDSPSALVRRVLRAVNPAAARARDATPASGRDATAATGPDAAAGARPSYAGLNHLGWLTAVHAADGADLLPGLLADDAALGSFGEGRLFGPDKLRRLGVVPNEYLHYYYETKTLVRAELDAPETRGEFLLRQQSECYSRMLSADADPLTAWTAALRQRDATYLAMEGLGERDDAEGGGYEEVALALMSAIARDEPADLILNVRNRGTIGFLDDDAVVEVPCRVDAGGARPYPGAEIPAHGVDLVKRIKATERAVLEAAASESLAVAVRAMASHPLVDSVPVARRLVAAYRDRFPELTYLR
ncbi:MAG: 6-phospho-beta-glucosidase [Actinoplanes sp.]